MNPIKPTFKTEIIPILLICVAIFSSFFFYQVFPDQVPTHWNIEGEVDQYSSKEIGAFLFPITILAVYAIFLLIPYLDPRKKRYEQFRKVYHLFKLMMISFLTLIYFITAANALGRGPSVDTWVPVMVGVLFMLLGNYMSKIKANWFMGIRTPWTLSSEEIWNKTHRVSGKLFMLGGLAMVFMPLYSTSIKIFVFIAIIIMLALGTSGYSLYLYLKENKNGKNNK